MCAQGSLDEGGGQQALILRLTAILPYNNLERAQAFFERLGFSREESPDDYRMLSDGLGGHVHLTPAVDGWLTPG